MADAQTFTNSGSATDVPVPFEMLTGIQRAYIDWKALDGVITDDDGVHQLTLEKLGVMLNPDKPILKQYLSQCCKNVPNFWDLVIERRKEFSTTSRLAYVHKMWYIKAAKVENWAVTEAWLRNHDVTFKDPKMKVEHDATDKLADLMSVARARRVEAKNAVEGEVIPNADNA